LCAQSQGYTEILFLAHVIAGAGSWNAWFRFTGQGTGAGLRSAEPRSFRFCFQQARSGLLSLVRRWDSLSMQRVLCCLEVWFFYPVNSLSSPPTTLPAAFLSRRAELPQAMLAAGPCAC